MDRARRDDRARACRPKPWGRVAVAVAPSKPNVVYAFIEASAKNALYRSDDGGKTWDERDGSQMHGLAPVLLRAT